MKKLLIILIAVTFSATTFAQSDKKAETKPVQAKETKTNSNPTHCYAMLKGKMTNCMNTAWEPMTKDITLKNGTVVTTKGEVTKDGKKTTLAEGQCIDLNGKIGTYSDVHGKMEDKKMDNKK